MPIRVPPDGPIPARIMIVGEAHGADEEREGKPFVGVSGREMTRMIQEAGISRSECFITNVCKVRPQGNDITLFIASDKNGKPVKSPKSQYITSQHRPLRDLWVTEELYLGFEELKKEIAAVKPNVIIAFGNVAMWALTGKWGIQKWRGSMLHCDSAVSGPLDKQVEYPKVIPTLHPANVLRQWERRAIAVQDIRRAARFRDGSPYPKPEWKFIVRPDFNLAKSVLEGLYQRVVDGDLSLLSFDIETRAGHTACLGIAWSLTEAICIPLMCVERPDGYWTTEQEAELSLLVSRLLTHPKAEVIGQNIIYDSQYTWRHTHFVPRVVQDTMISQHSIFSDLPKSLAFQASMYCDYYVYWKDEGKDWEKGTGEDELWYYNCEDCVYTLEVALAERAAIDQMVERGWTAGNDVHNFQQAMFWPVLQAMQRGVKIDLNKRSELLMEVNEEVARREQFLMDVLGHSINPRSPQQMHKLFYSDFQMPVQYTRATRSDPARPTLNDDALQKIARIEPLLKPIINCIADIRTLGIFTSILSQPLDVDGRMRCAFNIGGSESGKSAPKTYRLSSSENAFGSGTNLQNIPSEKSKAIGKAAARGSISALGDPYQFPNIRSMFAPDLGYTWFDLDLDRADLQVVVWEAEDELLKEALHLGVDLHLLNVFTLDGKDPPPLEELVETHPRYWDHRGPRKLKREFSKVFCHGTNYCGKARTMAAHTGRTIAEVERAQRIWFGAHPGIERWHKRVEAQVARYHFVENRFGYRWRIFDRVEDILPEAVAWIPQSTVSIVINRIWMNFYRHLPEVQVLLQVHDSLCGQIQTNVIQSTLPKMKDQARIVIPYSDPLTIPVGIKMSEKSWGDVQ